MSTIRTHTETINALPPRERARKLITLLNMEEDITELVSYFKTHRSGAARKALATHRRTPVAVLEGLVKDTDRSVRYAALRNPRTPADAISTYALTEADAARFLVIHQQLTIPAVVTFVMDFINSSSHSRDYVGTILRNDSLSIDDLEEIKDIIEIRTRFAEEGLDAVSSYRRYGSRIDAMKNAVSREIDRRKVVRCPWTQKAVPLSEDW